MSASTPVATTAQPTGVSTPASPTSVAPIASATTTATLPPSTTPAAATTPAPSRTSLPGFSAPRSNWQRMGIDGQAITAVAAALDGSAFYAGSSTGLWRAAGFTASWMQIATFPLADLTLDPSNPQLIFAAEPANCAQPGALHLSTDGGLNWNTTIQGAGVPVFLGAGKQAVASCAGTQLSNDNGATWRMSDTQTTVAAFAIASSDQTIVAAYYLANNTLDIRRSADGGATWADLTAPAANAKPPATGGAQSLAVTPAAIYLATGDAIYYTADNGATWQRPNPDLDGVPGALLKRPTEASAITAVYAAINNSAIFRDTGDQTWTTIALDPPSGQTSSLAYVASTLSADTLTPPLLLAATPDGVWRISLANAR